MNFKQTTLTALLMAAVIGTGATGMIQDAYADVHPGDDNTAESNSVEYTFVEMSSVGSTSIYQVMGNNPPGCGDTNADPYVVCY